MTTLVAAVAAISMIGVSQSSFQMGDAPSLFAAKASAACATHATSKSRKNHGRGHNIYFGNGSAADKQKLATNAPPAARARPGAAPKKAEFCATF